MAVNSLTNLGERTALAAVSSGVTTLHIGLYRTLPTNGGATGTEIGTATNASNYSRQAVTFGVPTTDGNGITSSKNIGPSSADVRFPAAASTAGTGGWGEVVGIGIFTAATGGNLVWYGTLTGGSRTLAQGDVILFENNQIELRMD